MVKKRIIPKFIISNNRLVKWVRYKEKLREAGDPVSAAKIYDSYGADEIIFVDVDATLNSRESMLNIINDVSMEVFMPLSAGGGIKSVDGISNFLNSGADKVVINTYGIENPKFIKEASLKFGKQCIAVSIDYKYNEDLKKFNVYTKGGTFNTFLDPIELSIKLQDFGAGEIIFSNIDRDGTMQGFDLENIEKLCELVDIPVIASSGAGSLEDCKKVLDLNVSGITISSLFLFTDQSPIKVRSYLASQGYNVRASKNSRN